MNSVQGLLVLGACRDYRSSNIRNYTKLKCIKVVANDRVDKEAYLEWLPEKLCLRKINLDFDREFDFTFSA